MIKEFSENFSIIGYPQLVRLNPNVPWKTRGNGAISIRIGKKGNVLSKIGKIDGKEIASSIDLTKDVDKSEYGKVKKIVNNSIEKYSKLDDQNTNPGFVCLDKKPNFSFYKKAVNQIVTIEETKAFLKDLNAEFKGFKNSRGLIGATAAVAWTPIKDKTYEIISYRQPQQWGKKRDVDVNSVMEMDKIYTSTFDNYDYKNKHNRIAPNSPCPILFGIRGDNADELVKASSIIKSEYFDSWLIFETNQGTDDHLVPKEIKNIQPYESVLSKGTLINDPHTIEGGHVIFSIEDNNNIIDCAAYEPTKQFRNVIRRLKTGDMVKVCGGVRNQPLTINLEKIEVKNLTKIFEKIENPICSKCKKHMKSVGTNQGFKCKICGTKKYKPKIMPMKRQLQLGIYEVPVCARRHLSMPLKRMEKN